MDITREIRVELIYNELLLRSGSPGSFADKLDECYRQLDAILKETHCTLVLLDYYIDAGSQEDYLALYSIIENTHKGRTLSPFSVISQAPADGSRLALGAHLCSVDANPEYREFEGISYTVFRWNNAKYVAAGGLQSRISGSSVLDQSRESFRLASGILGSEGMDFSSVFRQWNFIESITATDKGSQHYQVFNDVRSEYYSGSDFKKGYPAATGIGMKYGGVLIDFLATDHNLSWPVNNPLQINAYQYSEKVLRQNEYCTTLKKSTPKFERAKVISSDRDLMIYVSGTAAIRKEQSAEHEDPYRQTIETIENIEQLTGTENLSLNGIPVPEGGMATPASFKVYIKRAEDREKVTAAFVSKFGKHDNTLFLIGDICRPELLMEIEGLYFLEKQHD